MKMKPMLLLATLLLSALPTFIQAEGAPAMPLWYAMSTRPPRCWCLTMSAAGMEAAFITNRHNERSITPLAL